MSARALLLYVSLFAAAAAQAASFDCAKTQTSVEKMICTDETLSYLDDELAHAYQDALRKTDDIEQLKRWQEEWLEKRDLCGDVACLKQLYIGRVFSVVILSRSEASFDCAKASTEVEKMVCANKELAEIDYELAVAYRVALRIVENPEQLKQEQRAWLKERERCGNVVCLKQRYRGRTDDLENLSRKATKPQRHAGAPRYRLVAGMGYSVCEAYLKHLNAFPPDAPPMVCNVRPNPKFGNITQPEWEELDIDENLPLIYQAELQLPPYNKWQYKYRKPPRPFPSFEEWKDGFETRIKAGRINPKLYRTRLALNEKGTETLIGYEPDPDLCEQNLQKYSSTRGDGPHVLVLSSDTEEPLKIIRGRYGSDFRTIILLYRGKPYFAWASSYEPSIWGLGLSTPSSAIPETSFSRRGEYVLHHRCKYHFDK